MAEFASAEALRDAVARLRERGYVRLETYAPYDLPNVDRLLPHGRSRLPKLALVGGLGGGVFAYGMQWFADARSYPLNAGGRPLNAVPAFLVSTYESVLLAAALAAFFGLLVVLGLPEPWHPVFEVEDFERTSEDRFWVGIDARDPRFDARHSAGVLAELHPIRVVALPEHTPYAPGLSKLWNWIRGRR